MTDYRVTLFRNGDEDFPYRVDVSAASESKAKKMALDQLESENGDYAVDSVTAL